MRRRRTARTILCMIVYWICVIGNGALAFMLCSDDGIGITAGIIAAVMTIIAASAAALAATEDGKDGKDGN